MAQQEDGDGKQAIYQVFPKKGQVILEDVTRFLNGKKVKAEELFTERGRVDEVFRDLTRGAA